MFEHSQNDHFTVRGLWWLPDEENRVAGELCYTQKKLSLSLSGAFHSLAFDELFDGPSVSSFEIIHGKLEDHTDVTLLKSFYTHSGSVRLTTEPFEPSSSKLHCAILVIGVHLTTENDIFSNCTIELPSLHQWHGAKPFDFDHDYAQGTASLSYTRPETEEFKVSESEITIRFTHSLNLPALPFNCSPSIGHQTYLEIETDDSLPLVKFRSKIFEVLSLLSIVYGEAVQASRMLFDHPEINKPVSLFFPRDEVPLKDLDRNDFLLTFNDIKSEFPMILSNWMSANENHKRARRMLLSNERRPPNFIDLRFLSMAHIVEVIAKDAPRSFIIEPSEFKLLRNEMVSAIEGKAEKDLINSIKASLQYANSSSLRSKIKSLLETLDPETVALFSKNLELFISGIVSTRNHHTHYSTKKGKKILKGVEMYWAIHKMQLMARIILLLESGVPEHQLQSIVHENQTLSRKRNAWIEVSEEGTEYERED